MVNTVGCPDPHTLFTEDTIPIRYQVSNTVWLAINAPDPASLRHALLPSSPPVQNWSGPVLTLHSVVWSTGT